jgi:putative transposase
VTHCAYKFRIYPTPEQETVLRQTIGCCRFVYNWALAQRREAWVTSKKSVSYNATSKGLTELKESPEKAWLNSVSSVCLQQSLRNLDSAFVNFFKKRACYPVFKTRKNGGNARFLDNAFRIDGNNLFLAKIKTPLKVIWSRKLSGEPSQCVVSQNASGQWFASLLCEEEISKLPHSDKRIGIDLGIETFASTSDGQKFGQPKRIRRLRQKLVRLQRLHSRKQKGSKNREKARLKVARLHQHIADTRNDFLHKLSTKLIRENQTIALEDLAVKNMVKNRKLSRRISEQGWRSFRTMLEYKAEWYGRELLIVDRWFPSSKTCSCCGRKADLSLKDRKWTCECGATHDRDINAAKNILAAGQAVPFACGADARPSKDYVLRGSPQRSRKPKA